MNNYFYFYLEIGSLDLENESDCNFLWDDLLIDHIRIAILSKDPHIAVDGKKSPKGTLFELDVFNASYITNIQTSQSSFVRYALFLKNLEVKNIYSFFVLLTAKCAARGDIWEKFQEYASFPMDEAMWEWPEIESEKVVAYTPTMTWRFDGEAVAEGATMYDARIVITVNWVYEGKELSFTGYWYVTSVPFICQRLEGIDPYYRRFILLSHAFSIEHLRKQLQEELAYLSTIHPTKRELCLKHHFEYDGQTVFYQR